MPCFQLTRGAYPSSRRALLILTVNGFPIRRSICRVTGGSPFRLKRFQKKPITPASIQAMPKETDLSPALVRALVGAQDCPPCSPGTRTISQYLATPARSAAPRQRASSPAQTSIRRRAIGRAQAQRANGTFLTTSPFRLRMETIAEMFGEAGFQRLFEELSPKQRETLRLHFFEGYSLAEIAAKLGQSRGNIKHHYFRVSNG
jgi:RNA polymerase sigma factor (sigma-70 family)